MSPVRMASAKAAPSASSALSAIERWAQIQPSVGVLAMVTADGKRPGRAVRDV